MILKNISIRKSSSLIIFFLISICLLCINYFFSLRLTSGVFNFDFYFIWTLGVICWLFYLIFYWQITNKVVNIIILSPIFFYYIFTSLPDDKSLYTLITFISLIGIFLYLENQNYFDCKVKIILTALLITFLYEIIVAYLKLWENDWTHISPGHFYNSGIFANYLTLIIPLLLSIFIGNKSLLIKIVSMGIISAILPLLIVSIARAAFLGALVGVLFVLLFSHNFILSFKRKFIKVAVILLLLLIPLFIFFLYTLKPSSAKGRINIYKVSLLTVKDNPIFGLGINKFAAKYNLYQAEYFKHNEINIESQLLADNTLEAFNVILQILTEYGVVGFLILFYFFYVFIKKIFKNFEKINKNNISFGCLGGLITIITSSFFSNPFHCTPILLISTIYLSVVLSRTKRNIISSGKISRSKIIFPIICWLACTVYVIKIIITHSFAEKLWYSASKESIFGSFENAKDNYQRAYKYLNYNGDFLFNYGAEACVAKEFPMSICLLEEAKKYTSFSNLFVFLGESYEEMNEYSLAENNYIESVYIVPEEIYPKYKLIMLYNKIKKIELRNIWIDKVLNTPVKIESEISKDLIQQIKSLKS